MELISLLGILVSVGVFVYMSTRRYNLFLGSIAAGIIASLFNVSNPLTMLTENFMAGTTSFLKAYMLLFCVSALFGKLMYEAGALKSIAFSIYKMLNRFCKTENGVRFGSLSTIIIFYFIMNFAGISGYVVLFSVLYIAAELWREADVPWELYPYGTSTLLPAAVMGGSLYTTNVVAASAFGTTTFSGFWTSFVMVAIMFTVIFVMGYRDIVKRVNRNEGFLPSGEEFIKTSIKTKDDNKKDILPKPIISFFNLLLPIILNLLGAHVLVALLIGCICAILFNIKFFEINKIKDYIGEGVVSGINAIMGCAGMMGVFAIYKASIGFEAALAYVNLLPQVPGAALLTFVCSGITAQLTAGVTTTVDLVIPKYIAAGVSMETAHRMTILSSSFWSLPHNSGIVNGINLTKINPKRGFLMYIKTVTVPGIIALVISIILIQLGIFV